MAWDGGGLRDALHHPVGVAAVDRVACERAQDQVPGDALATASFKHSKDRTHTGIVAGLLPLPIKCITR